MWTIVLAGLITSNINVGDHHNIKVTDMTYKTKEECLEKAYEYKHKKKPKDTAVMCSSGIPKGTVWYIDVSYNGHQYYNGIGYLDIKSCMKDIKRLDKTVHFKTSTDGYPICREILNNRWNDTRRLL